MTSSCAWCSAATGRSCARCSATRRPAVPVFAINFGEIGFLATVEPEDLEDGIRRALSGDFELLQLPAIVLDARSLAGEPPHGRRSTTWRSTARWGSGWPSSPTRWRARMVGSVRCDGLVVATPAGSTGYNLANGGPVMAWGVEGFVVSFIAPHSLTARALVVAPGDRLTIHNRSREPLDVAVDGRPVGDIPPGGRSTRGSSTRSGRSPSCRARPSIAGCARSSAAWRADQATLALWLAADLRSDGGAVAVQRGDEVVELVAGEAPLAAGRPVAADVPGVGPAADRRQRDAEVAGCLRAREHEPPVAVECGALIRACSMLSAQSAEKLSAARFVDVRWSSASRLGQPQRAVTGVL